MIREEGELYVNVPPIPGPPGAQPPLIFEEEYGWFSDERPEDRIYLEAYRVLPLMRLDRVKQLGFLSPITEPMVDIVEFVGYSHRREAHSFIVARNFDLVLRNNGFPENVVRTGIFAGLAHDIVTPAGGDAIKALDPEVLDEEKNWQAVLTPEIKRFAKKYDVDLQLVDDMIQGRGLLGEVLSAVDRISYTYIDTAEIHGLGVAYQLPKNPYRDVIIDTEHEVFYFADPYRFHDIFMMRAMNHLQIYMAPINRGRDKLIQALVKPLYAHDGSRPLTPEILRSIDDVELMEQYIMKYYQLPEGTVGLADLVHNILNNLNPQAESFPPTEYEEAIDFVKELERNPDIFIIEQEQLKGFDPGNSYLVKDYKTGKPIPFKDFDPDRAYILDSLAKICRAYCIYFVDLRHASDNMKIVIEQIKTKRSSISPPGA